MSLSEPATPKKNAGRSPAADRRSITSVRKNKKNKVHRNHDSETEDSDDNESLESEQTGSQESKSARHKRKHDSDDWAILDGLRDGQRCEDQPDKHEGFMMKRRKWPMKGWHKRYFTMEKGILTYAKSPGDIQKGKLHGTIDIGLSVLTFKRDSRRIDIDADDLIYHLKAKSTILFDEWLAKMRHHRLYRQHEIAFGTKDVPKLTDVSTPVDDLTPITSPVSPVPPLDRQRGSFKGRTLSVYERSQSKVTAWLLDTAGIEQCQKELSAAQARIFELNSLLEKLNHCSLLNNHNSDTVVEEENGSSPNSATTSPTQVHENGAKFQDFGSINSKKEKSSKRAVILRRSNRKEKKLSGQDRSSIASLTVPSGNERLHTSSSNPNLMAHDEERTRPTSMPENWLLGGSSDTRACEAQLRDDFLSTARSVHDSLRSLSRTITTERERLKYAVEQEKASSMSNKDAYIQSLRQALTEALKQNADYRSRLARIHADSNVTGVQATPLSEPDDIIPSPMPKTGRATPNVSAKYFVKDHPLLQATASWESASVSEFYDAAEYLISSEETSEVSDEEEEEGASSDISDTENTAAPSSEDGLQMQDLQTGRRCKLPAPRPDTDISLWSLLCKNIGKDLSKISMPVTINEPLNMLQKLCEELEYSELLDKAAETDDPYERMVLVAAFSVSPYASTYYRAASKPFNPLLGETYECIREDKGWRFLAEQVSHHPPVSACYCDSKNFIFWQDMRIKTKFWGKSMEIQPVGTVHLSLPKYKDRYTWNKATTCVHNILGGQRWVDHYGEVLVKNETNGVTCKLTYAKSSYWSQKRHEVYGTVLDPDGKMVHQVFGKWNEGFYFGHAPSAKCVWRPGSMPEDYEMYYGFTRFAVEINDIDKEQLHLYPPTDTRFRPDQRLLEEGKVQEAENEKIRIEQSQRERRKKREEEHVTYSPRFFMKDEGEGRELYRYTGKYWELRKNPGFVSMAFTKLW